MTVTVQSVQSSQGRLSPWTRFSSPAQDGVLVAVAALFFFAHGSYALQTGRPSSVLFALEQAMLIGLFLVRRRPITVSSRWKDWVAAAIGGWLPLALRPADAPSAPLIIGVAIQVVGILLVLAAMGALGRSFGVVAANRGLKQGGLYRVVRHPIYAAHLVTQTGFLIANPAAMNLAIIGLVTVFQILRIEAEERVLRQTTDYGQYSASVRWRLVPGVY